MDEVLIRLKRILADDLALGLSPDAIDETASLLEDGLGLDSVNLLELIASVEQRFGFQFEDADLRLATFANLRSLASVIQKRQEA
jgi:acyl carrier protein